LATPQSAICPEASEYGIYLTFRVQQASGLRPLLAAIPALTVKLAKDLDEPQLLSAIAIGPEIWPAIFGAAAPEGLVPFAPVGSGTHAMPATPADLFLLIRSPRHDANFALARAITASLAGMVELIEEVHGFRGHQSRDLTGFTDGTENPKGDERAEVALVADGPHAGGSFVSIQRYVHDLAGWQKLAIADQEARIGRTKADDVEMPDEVKPPTAHIARVVIEDDGEELEILRLGLSYGTTREAGLYFIACGANPRNFRRMLAAMALTDRHGHYDHLLDFTRAVTGAAFFAPSVEFLAQAPQTSR